MSQDNYKRRAAQQAVALIGRSEKESLLIGVGTGSTVNHFIACIDPLIERLDLVISSSKESTALLRQKGIRVSDTNGLDRTDFYIDGADEINSRGEMIKGGGGAQTGEKILACVADCFICIVDDSKKVEMLGEFPVAVEVIPEARSYVSREIVKRFKAQPELRHNVVTDRNNPILDIYNLDLTNAREIEEQINSITGVIENGVFSRNRASLALIGGAGGVEQLDFV